MATLLICDRANPVVVEVLRCLDSVGLDLDVRELSDPLPLPQADVVLMMPDAPAAICDKILQSARRSLCLLTGTGAPEAILRRCDAFAVWPCSGRELRLRLSLLQDQAPDAPQDVDFARLRMLGRSPAFSACCATIRKLARSRAPILVQGETGTGKELAARALHYLGRRRGKPFIPVNCGALPETLFEAELFGHARGAFTDARTERRGLVSHAEGGSLFLDEVDSLTPKAQVALLRFLQDQRYRPVGSDASRQADVAIIAACNVDLAAAVRAGRFREDLYYRLDVGELTLPPLRAREGDIALLARHFIRRLACEYDEPPTRLGAGFIAWLCGQPWPGNIRQLENAVHRAWLMGDLRDLRRPQAAGKALLEGFDDARAQVVASFERSYLCRALELSEGNVSHAARLAGKERRSFGRLMQKHSIDRRTYQAG